MLEQLFVILYYVWFVILAFLTYVGLVELFKLKLKYTFLFTIGNWLIFLSNIVGSLGLSWSYGVCVGLGGIAFIFMSALALYREYERASSISQLLKKLPLKNRLLRIIPKELLMEPLPSPIPPPVPLKLAIGIALVISAAFGNIIYGIALYSMSLWTVPMDIPGVGRVDMPLPPAIQARELFSIIILCSIFLFISTVLILKEHYRAGSILALMFSILTAIGGGLMGFVIGLIGILGATLVLTRESR